MNKEDAVKYSTCRECKAIGRLWVWQHIEFGIFDGHIFDEGLTSEFSMPCLCGAPVLTENMNKLTERG